MQVQANDANDAVNNGVNLKDDAIPRSKTQHEAAVFSWNQYHNPSTGGSSRIPQANPVTHNMTQKLADRVMHRFYFMLMHRKATLDRNFSGSYKFPGLILQP